MAELTLDSTVVEEQVRRLNRQADSLGLLGVVVGAPVGAVIGGLPLVAHGPIPSKFGIATLLLGALLTGALGYILARGRSFGYRLKAQLLLGQLRLEQNIEALLAVSERPLPALPAPEPVQALPEAPRIEDLLDAGLAMPTHVPVVDYTPPAEAEEIAPSPEPEPELQPEPIQLPSWAADLEQAVAAVAPTVSAAAPAPEPAPEPVVVPEPVELPSWTADLERIVAATTPPPVAPAPAPAPEPIPEPVAVPEPVQLPSWAADLQQSVAAAAPTPAPAMTTPEPQAAPAWSLPAREEPLTAPTPPAWAEPQEIAPAPTPEPATAPEPAPAPVWAVPDAPAEEQPEAEEVAQPAPVQPQPATQPDLSTMSIAEIARLADAGAL